MLDHIRETLEMMREHELEEFELRRENLRLRVRKDGRGRRAAVPSTLPSTKSLPPTSVPAPTGEDAGVAVKSSTVGTFYPALDGAGKPLADVGQAVKAGQVLAVVRAINLTNEVRSACNGTIARAYVENGDAVGYGDLLFHIRPSSGA
jgi:acetyl-CoA carboxylase biotin carboxyl carrier protein